jgi:predicted GNAT family acetyltransferase
MIETYTNNHFMERFELRVDDELVAWIDYELIDGVLALNHTEVDSRFRGRGFAGDLVAFALAYALLRSLCVVPNCSYVASFLNSHPEYEGLVA